MAGGRSGAAAHRQAPLDGLGSTVWAMLDGRASIRAIAAVFAREQRLEAREAEVAVTQFVRELGRRGLVGLR